MIKKRKKGIVRELINGDVFAFDGIRNNSFLNLIKPLIKIMLLGTFETQILRIILYKIL